jgi:hypothetical protein
MDFQQLLAKMVQLDQPVGETVVPECGDPMGMTPPMGGNMGKPDTPPPSMSVNLNAQGMDDIAELMKLMTKVNPDMINQPEKPMDPIAMLTPPGPSISSIGNLGNLDAGPLKMLPNLDKDEPHSEPDADNMGGPSDMDADNMPPMGDLDRDDGDDVTKAMGDIDGDGDHDMDDHDAEKEEPEEKDKEEAFGNSAPGSDGPDYKGIDASLRNGDDLNKPKKSFSGKPYRGDNPMAANAYESKETLRANIRAELLQRLAEAKGAK